MHFRVKNILKNNCNYLLKHALNMYLNDNFGVAWGYMILVLDSDFIFYGLMLRCVF